MRLGTYFLPASRCRTTKRLDSWIREPVARAACRAPGGRIPRPAFSAEDYESAWTSKLDTICKMGFPGYFLIVADFIQWGKPRHPIGPGRGSGAGSLVAWALQITDLDPLPYGLLFERFLNPERVSMPDFDIDFCMDRREEVIDYVAPSTGAIRQPDHHLRHHGGQGRGARRRPRARASPMDWSMASPS
jgi:DNA polymerase-3 subunit alpha